MNDKLIKAIRVIIGLFPTESYRNDKNNNFYARIHLLKGLIRNIRFLIENADKANQKDNVIYDDLLNKQRDEVGAKQFLAGTLRKKKCLHLQNLTSEELITNIIWLLKNDCNHEYGKFENTSGSKLEGDELDKAYEEAKALQQAGSK